MNISRRVLGTLLAVSLFSAPAFADEGLASEGKTIDGFNFRLPVYNAKEVGSTVVGLDKFVGPDATDKKTKLLLLSFMASFCGPCKKEMPYLQALHERYAEQGLRVVMVSIDTEAEGQKKIDDLIAANKVTFPILKDRFNLAARRWLGSKTPLPSVFLIKPDGTIQTVHRGYNDEASALFASAVESAIGLQKGTIAATIQMPAATADAEVKQVSDDGAAVKTVPAVDVKKAADVKTVGGKKTAKKGGATKATATKAHP